MKLDLGAYGLYVDGNLISVSLVGVTMTIYVSNITVVSISGVVGNSNRTALIFPIHINSYTVEVEWPGKENL